MRFPVWAPLSDLHSSSQNLQFKEMLFWLTIFTIESCYFAIAFEVNNKVKTFSLSYVILLY